MTTGATAGRAPVRLAPAPRPPRVGLARRALRKATRLLGRPVVRLLRATVPVHWRYRGAYARACLRTMGVGPWARLTPLQRTYVDFALSTNERGRWAAGIIERYRPIRGARGLDIGCAYGGFLVALGQRGAREIVGIDVAPTLLELARVNLAEHAVAATLAQVDITDTPRVRALGRFDVIVINDVLEHVLDLPGAIANTCGLVAPGGLLFAVVPNKYYVGYLRQDGHYQLPGLTLLARGDALAYFAHARPVAEPYTVGYYRTLPYYLGRLSRHGLTVELFPGGLGLYDVERLRAEFVSVQRLFGGLDDGRIPARLLPKIVRRARVACAAFGAMMARYDAVRQARPDEAAALADAIVTRFGMEAWYLIGRRPAR